MARKLMTMGNPPSKKPNAVPIATAIATVGEINMAMKVATWLAKVKEAGSRIIFNGDIIGIKIPIAINNAAIVRVRVLVFVFKIMALSCVIYL